MRGGEEFYWLTLSVVLTAEIVVANFGLRATDEFGFNILLLINLG